MEKAFWFFDVISPYSYLHFHGLTPLRDRLQIQAVPVLLAGLLKHWGTKGPAEVPPKRLHTYQHCVWSADQHGLLFRMPSRHPFNSLSALRLLVALGASDDYVASVFNFIYGEGGDPELGIKSLAERLNVPDVETRISRPEVKQQLASNTQRAIALGVFGVPTLVVRDRLFWGSDTVDWTRQFLDDPELFTQPAYRAVSDIEFGATRK